MTTLAVQDIDATLVVAASVPTQLVAALDPPLVLEIAPLGATLAVTVMQAGVLTTPAAQGPEGPPGPEGPAGPDGAPGGNTTYPFSVPQPILTWSIAHGLNRFPSITIVDTAGDVMDVVTTYVDSNNIIVSFTAPVAGTAYLN